MWIEIGSPPVRTHVTIGDVVHFHHDRELRERRVTGFEYYGETMELRPEVNYRGQARWPVPLLSIRRIREARPVEHTGLEEMIRYNKARKTKR